MPSGFRKMITNKEIKSLQHNKKNTTCSKNCECKDIPPKVSAPKNVKLVSPSYEDRQAFMLNNEEIQLSTVSFTSDSISRSVSDLIQSSNCGNHIDREECPYKKQRGSPTKISTNEICSQSCPCNCQTFHAKPTQKLNNEDINLSIPHLTTRALRSHLASCETNIACEECSTKILTDEEIHSRRISFRSDVLKIASKSSSNAALLKKVLSDCDHTSGQSPLITCKSSMACELSTQMLTNKAFPLESFSYINEAQPTKTASDLSQLPNCETHISCEVSSTEMLTDEETNSRSSKRDSLLTEMSTMEDITRSSLSSSNGALAKIVRSDSCHTVDMNKSSSFETYSSGGLPTKILSTAFNKSLCMKTFSDQSQSFSGEIPIASDPPGEIATGEENISRSSVCEALLKKILSNEEIHIAPLSCISETNTNEIAPVQPQSVICGTRMICDWSPLKVSTGGSQSLLGNGFFSVKNAGTDSQNDQIRAMGALSPLDPSSYSRPELAIIKHISLNLNVDFDTHVLSGQAKLDFDVLQDINDLVLDASNLKIESIEAEDGKQLRYEMGEHLANMGSKLTIFLPQQLTAGETLSVKIKYSTDPQASALQWLDPEQTSGKKHPYLFSQCQPIHARSILPCQDSPAVKFTYDAEVTAPAEFTVLMSALRGVQKGTKTTFRQPMPLPSYLVALAVGVLESRSLGPRSKVWSEKEEIERSAWEFAETEKYLQAAEKLCGPYEWTQYDLLVLPPSFPYGGMENPCLTFVTPTLLAGDRSQADVIVHEIMHSWTGNLVTNNNFEHFWLNEGFTVFLERKVAASLINDPVEAKRSRDFHSLLGLQELNEAIQVFGSTSPLTNLVVDLEGIHPDDAFSRVPYEKGSLFLRYLEDLVGGPEVFDDFLRAYLTKFRKKSLDTDQFQKFFVNYFKGNDALKKIDWDTWLYKSGMPPIIPDYDTTMTKAISALIVKIDDPNAPISHEDVEAFTPHQMIHMLQQLIDRPALPIDRLTALGTAYKVNGNKNTEILYRWLRLCIRSRDQSKVSEALNFVNSQGRMKYVRPIYRDLYAWEDVRQQAIDNFLKNERYMMHVSAYTLRKDLHLEDTSSDTNE